MSAIPPGTVKSSISEAIRAAEMCSTLKPFQSSFTSPNLSTSLRRGRQRALGQSRRADDHRRTLGRLHDVTQFLGDAQMLSSFRSEPRKVAGKVVSHSGPTT